jgi:hypothetical protein
LGFQHGSRRAERDFERIALRPWIRHGSGIDCGRDRLRYFRLFALSRERSLRLCAQLRHGFTTARNHLPDSGAEPIPARHRRAADRRKDADSYYAADARS